MPHLVARPLGTTAFAPYGQVVESAVTGRWINDGNAWRSEAGEPAFGGHAALAVFRARARDAAGPWHELERHQLGTQSFLPMGAARCVLLVALGNNRPDPATLAAFVSGTGQGWTLAPGTWHHALIVLDDVDVAVLERRAPDGEVDCDIARLDDPVTIALGG